MGDKDDDSDLRDWFRQLAKSERQRSARDDDRDSKIAHDESPDDKIADLLLGEGEGLSNVANHLANSPGDPLPPDLLLVLRAWLEKHHGVRITRVGKRGREPSEWLHLAERLTEGGFSVIEACRQAKKYLGLEVDEEVLLRGFRRYRQSKGPNPARDVGEAIVHDQRTKFLNAFRQLSQPSDE